MILRVSTKCSLRTQLSLLVAVLWYGFSNGFADADRPTGTEPEVGIRARTNLPQALVHARIVIRGGEELEDATLVIDQGVIVAVGRNVSVPSHAHVIDMTGRTIYPALIDAYSEVNVSRPRSKSAHWNKAIRPEQRAIERWEGVSGQDTKLREAGFAIRLVAPKDGVLKGRSAVVTTSDVKAPASVLLPQAANHVRLTAPRSASREDYPQSPMGAVAIARQTCFDALWYGKAWRAYRRDAAVPRPETNLALASLAQSMQQDELFIIDAPDEQYALRADQFAREFGLNLAIRGSGREYQRLAAIVDCQRVLIIPVDFPKPPNVATVEAARDATLAELMHWRLAPENPQRLLAAGCKMVLTSHGLNDPKEFRARIRQAVERGLDADAALHACTAAAADLLGIGDKAGTLEVGKGAHLMVTDGTWLDKKTKIRETWIDGKRFTFGPSQEDRLAGTWEIDLPTATAERRRFYLHIQEKGDKLQGTVSQTQSAPSPSKPDSPNSKGEQSINDKDAKTKDSQPQVKLQSLSTNFGRLTTAFSAKLWNGKGTVRLSGTAVGQSTDQLVGTLMDETGQEQRLSGRRLIDDEVEADTESPSPSDEIDSTPPTDPSVPAQESTVPTHEIAVNFPLGAFGAKSQHRQPSTVVLENATVWTCNEAGDVLENASIVLQGGKIVDVGRNLHVPENAQRVDARGKHITPGIIDCHSHMATDGGVNEGSQAITAEVRIGDFIDATDITIYRQLAGGLTCANILHGSANPIGGQNQVIKLRWGQLPEALKFSEAPAGIKFALGENVKQSNWGDEYTTRYPQTRMGVEQIMRDALIAAQQYEQEWKDWHTTRRGIPPRRDLELDAIVEILNGERWIHCHSYRQDEILALMRTLEAFQIQIGTFQHILEGYKVAHEMVAHGAMGSAFSDWWTYKFEVRDAIPYNGALMHNAGVVVSFNSDDRELARHLNHEAAKAIKYGGVPATEALKFVTLNPAKQLRIEQYVGSVEVGKHADLAVWSGPPLSILSRCEQTWIDGIRYFDREQDLATRRQQVEVREHLVRWILDSGETMREPGEKENLLRDYWPRYDEYCGHGGHGHGDH